MAAYSQQVTYILAKLLRIGQQSLAVNHSIGSLFIRAVGQDIKPSLEPLTFGHGNICGKVHSEFVLI